MTVHTAKGLEWPVVFLAGLEEGLFPHSRSRDSESAMEEERRLFYVAITRAQKRLFSSYALTRYRFGRLKNCEPSRFLDDVDMNFIKLHTRSGGVESAPPPSQYAKNLVNGIKKNITSAPPPPKTISYQAPRDFMPSDTSALQAGMKVEHPIPR